MKSTIQLLIFVSLAALFASCMSYYRRNLAFNQAFEQQQLEQAANILSKYKKGEKNRHRLLYFMNQGTVQSILGNYALSNDYFEKAYLTIQNSTSDVGEQALSFVTNPEKTTYYGENHEQLLIYYYKALNFLKLGDKEKALVECKRMNIALNQLNDKYTKKNKYQRDAFIHVLMGIIYEANFDYNNAFIAYRNAYNIYEEDYKTLFGFSAPEQLKQDLVRAAYLTGFISDAQMYEKKFNIKYVTIPKDYAHVVVFWHSGLSPVKSEWSANFTVVPGVGSNVTFVNQEMGFSFDYQMRGGADDNILKTRLVRMALPQYTERPRLYQTAQLQTSVGTFVMQKCEDINAIAKQCLKDRMLKEVATAVVRLAVKQGMQEAARIAAREAAEANNKGKNNQNTEAVGDLAALSVGLFTAFTEKADTRNWQTLPHSIYYSRVALPAGSQTITFSAQANNGSSLQKPITINTTPGSTHFQTIHTLDHY